MTRLNWLDWLIVVLYFAATFIVAFWVTRRKTGTRDTSAGYFLAGRNEGWFIIGASLFAANIGSEHLVGLAGTGASSGVAVGQFEVIASLILLILAWVFVPFYVKSGVFTMPEFLERRYSPAARWYLAGVSIIAYVLTKISVTIAAGALVMERLAGIPFWTAALVVVIATGIYTVFGGLKAVLYTDMVQMFILIGGSATVVLVGLAEVGGWGKLYALSGQGFFDMFKPMDDPSFPWTGIMIGAPILGIWYWCTDQFIVQRVLSASNVEQARRGAIFAGYLKLLPLFIMVIPGLIAFALNKTGRIHLDKADHALPTLVAELLPMGVRGIVVAGLLAALMSSLSAVFNSCSTLITLDVYKKMQPEASERTLVWVGQVSTAVMVISGLLWIPFMKNISEQIYQYLQSVQAYVSPPIAAVFLIGIFWKRVNSRGAMTALLAGFVLGMGRLVLELNKSGLTDGGVLHWFATINFLHFAIFLFVVCTALLIIVSLATRAEPEAKLAGLTFQTVPRAAEVQSLDITLVPLWQRVSFWLSVVLVAAVLSIWIYFSE